METQEDFKIDKLLEEYENLVKEGRVLGYSVDDKVAKCILSFDTEKVPGVKMKTFNKIIRSNTEGEWTEYQVLYEINKYLDTPEYLSHVFNCLGKIIKSFSHLSEINSIGIQEFDGSHSGYYYILVYILSDGKEFKKSEFDFSDIGEIM